MIARAIGTIHYEFYGTEEACLNVESGAAPSFIGFDEANAFVPDAAWLARRFPRARRVFATNNHHGQAVAARSGAGLVLLPHYIGRLEPLLRLIDLGELPRPCDLFILTRRRDRTAIAVPTVADAIAQLFKTAEPLFLQ